MKKVAFCTLGCKVNQYDSEAMLEKFLQAGYGQAEFAAVADVYVINTCVVTGQGEKKSRQMIRRAQKTNPDAMIVVAGCLAQRDAEQLLQKGVHLVIGNQRRGEVVALLNEAQNTRSGIAAVSEVQRIPFENLQISGHAGHTRAVLKIQEGCDRYCTYCIIPYVRGGLRSRTPQDIAVEAARLAEAGFAEVVLTGIHLTSYGRDLQGETLLDAIRAVHAALGIRRIRLGSLEPVVVTEDFVSGVKAMDKVCPQFHLALQSGCDTVLERMRRRYTTAEYFAAVQLLKAAFPGCAVTTDMIAGFPGETEEEHRQTLDFIQKIGFARMHVFPYSRRTGTKAADMPGQVDKAVKERRAHDIMALAQDMQNAYARSLLNTVQEVLFETDESGKCIGYTPQYLRVEAQGAQVNDVLPILLTSYDGEKFLGEI